MRMTWNSEQGPRLAGLDGEHAEIRVSREPGTETHAARLCIAQLSLEDDADPIAIEILASDSTIDSFINAIRFAYKEDAYISFTLPTGKLRGHEDSTE